MLTNIEIKTPTGYQAFSGINRWKHNSYIEIVCTNKKIIKAAKQHKFFVLNKRDWVFAEDLSIGDCIGKTHIIKTISEIFEQEWFYDPINVANGQVYYNDGDILSHNSFLGTGDTLIDGNVLMGLRAKNPLYEQGDTKVYEEAIEGHEYVLMADVAKGRGQDYSTFSIIDITAKPFKQVAVYRNNRISPLLFPEIIYKWATAYNEAYVVIESNDQGMVVCNGLYHDLEYENMHVESVTKGKMGLEITRKTKRIGCTGFKDILESGNLEIVDEETIKEISTFSARGNSFEASPGNHDDLVMNLVMFGYFAGTQWFSDMTDISLREFLFKQKMEEIEADVIPFGFIDTGTVENELEAELPGPEWSLVDIDEFSRF